MSPIKAMYGREPLAIGESQLLRRAQFRRCDHGSLALQSCLDKQATMQDLLQQHLQCARLCMKHQADKKRSDCTFSLCEQVFLRHQLYIRTSIDNRVNQKLVFRYYGPYDIIPQVNDVAYKAEAAIACVQPVFHVSHLHCALLPGTTIEP